MTPVPRYMLVHHPRNHPHLHRRSVPEGHYRSLKVKIFCSLEYVLPFSTFKLKISTLLCCSLGSFYEFMTDKKSLVLLGFYRP